MPNLNDLLVDRVKNSWTEVSQSTANAAVTVTHAAVAGRRHIITKVDASYSSSTVSAELTVSQGATVIGRKYIHGAGAIDFGVDGLYNPDANEAVSATLAAGGSGVTGDLTLQGFSTDGN